MGLMDGLKQAVEEALGQITKPGSSPTTQDIYFTDNFQKKAKEWKVSENDALDVYYHGKERKPNMRVKKYNGYELGIYYGHGKTGQVYISTIWKRPRR
ncbi:MAG TPA: hypothetical protein VEP90_08560 [Methylomirabilota bacterium]|nr:hypothetical protein [Methylomirabilota bacterium]